MDFSEDRVETIYAIDGEPLMLHVWEPPSPQGVLLGIHGGLAHAGDYVTPALFFKDKGYATIAPDLRGHKQTKVDIKNFDLYVKDMLDVLDWINGKYPDLPIFIVGHSMGGLIATVMGLKYPTRLKGVRGFILSSPYYRNVVPVPKIMEALSGVFATILPKMKVPAEDFIDVLTHDEEITKRHHEDERKGLRGKYVTARWAHRILSTQKWVEKQIHEWKFPLYVVVAGKDKLADTSFTEQLLQRIKPDLVKLRIEPENYHENFNEINRQEIFDDILEWLNQQK
ncbi:MAG: alpha/beta fold hydrolase [Methanobacteriota archaeon]|nr:MAG: alpha/beta fold hydrolase [Euryarchaeota archaeon]